jgi:MFS family permease
MRFTFTGLWKNPDFLRLWSGQTISALGTMIGGTAMSFTAILFLEATPFQMGVLNVMQILPALLVGLFAGAWVDRVRRRPLLIGADLGRAFVLASVPLAALLGVLRIEQIYLVALLVGVLSILFDVAYQSYLPALVGKDDLVEGNSKLTASGAVAEFAGFSVGGWLVQALTAPLAVLIDAFSFIVSAAAIGSIRAREAEVPVDEHPNMRREIVEGLKTVWHASLLRASALAVLMQGLTDGIYGSLVVLYMSRDLGFSPGVLSMTWAVGGISAFIGASLAPRVSRRLGSGLAMGLGLVASGISAVLIPLATGSALPALLLLIGAQFGDGFFVIYDINQVSLRQGIASERVLGRVNATMRFLGLGASLVGAVIGGLLGELLGVRWTLFIGAGATFLAGLVVLGSPLRKYRL